MRSGHFELHWIFKPFLEDIRKTLFQNADILKTTPQELMLSQYFTSSAKPILSLQLHQKNWCREYLVYSI